MKPEIRRTAAVSLLLVILLASLVTTASASEEGQSISVVGKATLPALAVVQLQNGTMIGSIGNITVRVLHPGKGYVYVSTEPLSDVDMQASVRAAVLVASFYAKRNPLEYDFLVSIEADAPIVGGPSAGSAIMAAVYLALTGIEPQHNVASTGMILPDGTIGPVGGIPYKVQAAIDNGYTTVLIPQGQSIYVETTYERVQVGRVSIVRPVTVTWNVTELAARLGGRVIEVSTALDVIRGFTGTSPFSDVYREPWVAEEELLLMKREFENYTNETTITHSKILACISNLGRQTLRANVESQLNLSRAYLVEAQRTWERGLYYPALSFAFVSSYYAVSALLLCEAARNPNPSAYLDRIASNLSDELIARWRIYDGLARDRTKLAVDELFILSEVYDRLENAEGALEQARSYLLSEDFVNASLSLGYLWSRIRSIDFWLDLYEAAKTRISALMEIEADRFVSLILSYSHMSVNYLSALMEVVGAQEQDYSYLYEKLNKASSLIIEGNYPGALSLAMSVLVDTTIAMQELYSLNLTAVVNILSSYARLILANTLYTPAPARFYVSYADVYREAGEVKVALSYYEKGLVILHATGMAMIHVTKVDTPPAPASVPKEGSTNNRTTQATPTEEVNGAQAPGLWRHRGFMFIGLVIAIIAGVVAYMALRPRSS